MEELTKKELLDYLEEISQQLNNIALDQIPFAISELYFKLENSVPISLIEKKIEEIKEYDKKVKTYTYDGRENFTLDYCAIPILQEILDERNYTNGKSN